MKRGATLRALLKANRNAGTVYLAMAHLAKGRRRPALTRAAISEICGLSERLVGEAIDALDQVGIITRRYRREGKRRVFYRILMPKDVFGFVSVGTKTTLRKRSIPCRKRTIGKRKQAVSDMSISSQSLLTKRGVAPVSAGATTGSTPAHPSTSADAAPPEELFSIVETLGLRKAVRR